MFKKIFTFIFVIAASLLFASVLYPIVRGLMLKSGIVQVEISIAGTGSMYPTFPKGTSENDVVNAKEIVAWPKMKQYPSGINIFGNNIFSYKLKRGDIVEIDNEITKKISKEKYGEDAGFVKRIIALEGDRIELRDGFVYLNGSILDEPYTAKPRSTYGGKTISDCKVLKVPSGQMVVMGDNRKASLDSRFELGLVDIKSINYVLPYSDQSDYRKLWRDSSKDFSLAHTTTFDAQEFVVLLNNKRKEKNIKSLKFVNTLSNSARQRGKVMLDTNDFSTEATKSGTNLSVSVKEAGYSNILLAEAFTLGYYESGELLDNLMEFPETKKILLSSQYQDIGLSPVLGDLEGCPTQVVVVHFGGYVPPNYKKDEIDSWQKLVNNLNEVVPTFENFKNAEGIDQDKLNRLITVTNQRKNNAEKILKRMKANEWLSNDEERLVKDDKSLGEEAQKIIGELNK
jgi:signal peptidase I